MFTSRKGERVRKGKSATKNGEEQPVMKNRNRKKMRLCFLADPNHVNTRNWVEYFAGPLGHEVHLLCLSRVINPIKNVVLHGLELPLRHHKIRYLLSIPKAKEAVKRIKPDILIGYRITSYGFVAAATGFHPLVLAAQGQNIVYPSHSIALHLTAHFALKRADLINAWAPHMAQRMIKLGANQQKIITLPRGIDTELFCRKNGLPTTKTFRIISTRSLRPEPHYNIETIIKALHLALGKNPDLEYIVAGDGPRRKFMMEYASKLGLESHVKFLGEVDNALLPELLRSCQVYVSNVWSDGVSSSLLEAMACGLFPIVVDNISNREWIEHGQNGFLVPPDKPEILAAAIARALEDKRLRLQAAEINNRMVSERASWRINMSKIEAAYLDLLQWS